MKKLLKFLLTYKFRTQKLIKKGGFTLIELLVGLIMAALILTPLLGFMINVMTSDRQEQAKSASEQEIQTALDYIGRDLSQSIFIYDGFGLQTIASQLLPANPAGTEFTPVLVFWKREFISKDKLPSGTQDDAYVLSLVAYYLIKDNPCNSNPTWSCTARIGRLQLNDAVRDPGDNNTILNSASQGFSPFGFTGLPPGATEPSTQEGKLNLWKRSADIDTNQIETLIDYVDQTLVAATNPPGPTIAPCSTEGRADKDRPDVTLGANDDGLSIPYPYRQVPNYTGTGAVPTSLQTGSFYACVNTDKTLAQVFIRGNSVARIQPRNNPPTYSVSQSAYFPKANIQVQGRGQITKNPES